MLTLIGSKIARGLEHVPEGQLSLVSLQKLFLNTKSTWKLQMEQRMLSSRMALEIIPVDTN